MLKWFFLLLSGCFTVMVAEWLVACSKTRFQCMLDSNQWLLNCGLVVSSGYPSSLTEQGTERHFTGLPNSIKADFQSWMDGQHKMEASKLGWYFFISCSCMYKHDKIDWFIVQMILSSNHVHCYTPNCIGFRFPN